MKESLATRWFEDFSVGQKYAGGPRLIRERDLLYCTLWCGDGQPHSNEEYSRATPWGRRILHGDAMMAVGAGMIHSHGMFVGSLVGYEGMEIKFPRPIYIGDQISAQLTIDAVDPRPSKPAGLVTGTLTVHNDTLKTAAITAKIQYAVKRRA
jgi:acyl dehydratase